MVLRLRNLATEITRSTVENLMGKLGGMAVTEDAEGIWAEMTANVSQKKISSNESRTHAIYI